MRSEHLQFWGKGSCEYQVSMHVTSVKQLYIAVRIAVNYYDLFIQCMFSDLFKSSATKLQ